MTVPSIYVWKHQRGPSGRAGQGRAGAGAGSSVHLEEADCCSSGMRASASISPRPESPTPPASCSIIARHRVPTFRLGVMPPPELLPTCLFCPAVLAEPPGCKCGQIFQQLHDFQAGGPLFSVCFWVHATPLILGIDLRPGITYSINTKQHGHERLTDALCPAYSSISWPGYTNCMMEKWKGAVLPCA